MGGKTRCAFGQFDATSDNIGRTWELIQVWRVKRDVTSCFLSLPTNPPGERE